MQQLEALEQRGGTNSVAGDMVDKYTLLLPTGAPNIVDKIDISKDIADDDNIPMSGPMDTSTQLLGEDEVG